MIVNFTNTPQLIGILIIFYYTTYFPLLAIHFKLFQPSSNVQTIKLKNSDTKHSLKSLK